MANPQSQLNTIREYATTLNNGLLEVQGIIAKIDALGGADFFQTFLEGSNEPDLTWTEFVTFYTTLKAMQTWIETNAGAFAALSKR